MGSSAKRRQTFNKTARERAVQEKRELKRQKKAERKAAAAEGRDPFAPAEDEGATDGEGAPAGQNPADEAASSGETPAAADSE